MKKISTVAAKQIRNFSQQKLTIGLDLRDLRAGTACWMNEGESRDFPGRPPAHSARKMIFVRITE